MFAKKTEAKAARESMAFACRFAIKPYVNRHHRSPLVTHVTGS
ncbi:hypothetical protein U1707_10755 [Sphingomonas sp. PB2P12]